MDSTFEDSKIAKHEILFGELLIFMQESPENFLPSIKIIVLCPSQYPCPLPTARPTAQYHALPAII